MIVGQLGYVGLFLAGLIEVFPLPAEVIVIPAGYLVQQGQMNLALVLLASGLGTTAGATLNYWLVRRFGRVLVLRFAHYLLLNESKLATLERFFFKHGPVSIFLGRLVPGVRHYLFLPAGLARMPALKFTIFTAMGAFLWTGVLVTLGYIIGKNQALAVQYLPMVKLSITLFIIVFVAFYALRSRMRGRVTNLD